MGLLDTVGFGQAGIGDYCAQVTLILLQRCYMIKQMRKCVKVVRSQYFTVEEGIWNEERQERTM